MPDRPVRHGIALSSTKRAPRVTDCTVLRTLCTGMARTLRRAAVQKIGDYGRRAARCWCRPASRQLVAAIMGASDMAVRTSTPAQASPAHIAPHTAASWAIEPQSDTVPPQAEGRAERWATWVLIYLAALTTSLAIGASVWALGLVR